VIMHDSHHGNQRELKEYLRFFVAAPMSDDYDNYFQSHSVHHEKLSTKEDPDHGFGNTTSLEHYHADSKNFTKVPEKNKRRMQKKNLKLNANGFGRLEDSSSSVYI
jgi:fatty-acid desaturase